MGGLPLLPRSYVDELASVGLAAGLDAFGVAPGEPLARARQAIDERIAAEQHDGMPFTFRNPERSTTPALSVRDARAIVVGARNYEADEPAPPGEPVGRVARYARADHYAPLRRALWQVAYRLRADGWKAVAYADDNSLVDREAAYQGGIGWFGKNANLLLPGAGSWFVLGGVVTDAPLPTAEAPVADGCGVCTRCLTACPTGAIVAPGVVDARRCLAWLVQKPGIFPVEHRAALGDRIYGCDDCQEVCPPTVRFGHRRPGSTPGTAWVPLIGLLDSTDDELLARHGRWYLADRDPLWLRRNALVALANVLAADPLAAHTPAGGPPASVMVEAERVVAAALAHPRPELRAHAVWAARRLGFGHLLTIVAADPDTVVQTELHRLTTPTRAPTA